MAIFWSKLLLFIQWKGKDDFLSNIFLTDLRNNTHQPDLYLYTPRDVQTLDTSLFTNPLLETCVFNAMDEKTTFLSNRDLKDLRNKTNREEKSKFLGM